jgi:endonuclease IV
MSAFGIHISKSSFLGDFKSLEQTIDKIVSEYDLSAYQIFTHNPQSDKRSNLDYQVIKSMDKAIVYVHSNYLTDGYWGAVEIHIQDTSSKKINTYFKRIQDQLDAAHAIGSKGLVIHITRKPIPVIAYGLKLLEENIKQHDVKIILEFRAMKPNKYSSYETVEQINALTDELRKVNIDWGFCIDTSHMWATGFDISNSDELEKWLRDINCVDKIALFHLNAASNDTFGVGKDVHIIPFAKSDDMWGGMTNVKSYDKLSDSDFNKIFHSSLGILLKWAKKNRVPVIGEFKRGTLNEFKFAIDVIQGILQLA